MDSFRIKELKFQVKELNKVIRRYRRAYMILMSYWDSLPDDEKPKIDKQLKKLGL